PFEENPKGWKAFWKSVGNWIDEHADVLKTISDVLITVGSLVALLPGLGTLVGGIIAGIGVGIGLALTLTGNMSWGEFAMSAAGAFPGGKAAQVGKLAKFGRACRGEPVDMASGDVVDTDVDVRIDGVFPFVFERHLMTSFRAGRSFGPSWVSLLDCVVEIDRDQVMFIGPDGAGVGFGLPEGDGEVGSREVSGWRLSFVDGAYRVRDVAAGVTYVFAVTGEASSVRVDTAEDTGTEGAGIADAGLVGGGGGAAEVSAVSAVGVPESSLAGVTDFSVVVGCTAVVHHSGHRYEIDYDPRSGFPVRVRLSGGAVVSVATDAVSGRVVGLSVSDGSSSSDMTAVVEVVRYGYSAADELVEVINSSGQAMRYEYDGAGRMCGWTDRNGTAYRHRFDGQGRCVAQAGTAGVYANAFVYLPDTGPDAVAGGTVSVIVETATAMDVAAMSTPGGGGQIGAVIDRLSRLPLVSALTAEGVEGVGVRLPGRVFTGGGGHVAAGEAVLAGVDEALLVDEVLGDVRFEMFRCDPDGQVWQEISAAGGIRTLEFDRQRVAREVDAAGVVTRWRRDRDGLVLAEETAQGAATSIEYAPLGMATRLVDAAGRVTEVTVDVAGNVVAVTRPDGSTTRYDYDYRESGSVLAAITDPGGARTVIESDAAGRPVRVIDPAGRVVSYERDVFGNVTSVLDPEGHQTRQRWSAHGHLLERVHADGSREEATYDAEGNLVAAVDEIGGRHGVRYGVMDATAETVTADGALLRLAYDSQLQIREGACQDVCVRT
ncbi:DUF6531 domain-containing protein, partial [Gordonia sp. NPDC003422]